MTDNTKKRVRVRALRTGQDCVAEGSLIYSLFRRGEIARADCSVAINAITAVRNMIETSANEERLTKIEDRLEQIAANTTNANVVQFKRQA